MVLPGGMVSLVRLAAEAFEFITCFCAITDMLSTAGGFVFLGGPENDVIEFVRVKMARGALEGSSPASLDTVPLAGL